MFIKPEHPERANADALMVQHKTLADLSIGISKEEAIEKLNKFLNEDGLTPAHRCFIAHNYMFDKKFMHALYDKIGQQLPVDLWVCTMSLTRAYAKQIGLVKPKVNLHAALDICNIKKLSEAHASKVDSRNTYLLWNNLINDKKIDYLPFIKNAAHIIKTADSSDDNEGLDPALLDL
jgi:DNA polymerase III epsilon subunit-like protein